MQASHTIKSTQSTPTRWELWACPPGKFGISRLMKAFLMQIWGKIAIIQACSQAPTPGGSINRGCEAADYKCPLAVCKIFPLNSRPSPHAPWEMRLRNLCMPKNTKVFSYCTNGKCYCNVAEREVRQCFLAAGKIGTKSKSYLAVVMDY